VSDLDVPDAVRRRALAEGDAGQRWLDGLPAVVARLADRWGLDLGQALAGGTAAFVVAATRSDDGRACVLKVGLPLFADDEGAEDFARSVRVHQLAAGRGCAELLAHDAAAQALLLERLGPNLHDLELPLPEVLVAIAATLRELWRPFVPEVPLPNGAEGAAWLHRCIDRLWNELGGPCERAVVDRALELCERRATDFDADRAVLVHGDAHGWNTLAVPGGAGECKLVDPEGLWSSPEHDLAVPMREYNEPLLDGDTPGLVRERAELLAGVCEVDPQAVWEWGFVERVSTGLTALRSLGPEVARPFLEVAARCL
jgi:streptomycin 6-kinase